MTIEKVFVPLPHVSTQWAPEPHIEAPKACGELKPGMEKKIRVNAQTEKVAKRRECIGFSDFIVVMTSPVLVMVRSNSVVF
jgi:hypothetical protein